MPDQRLVILSDAHLGPGTAEAEEALLAFLEQVPALGDRLLINGDLFDFWFAYRRAIPRAGFRVAAALARLACRIPVALTGGNHDRWGDSFWDRDAAVHFGADGLRLRVGDREVLALHGDGIVEQHWGARVIHRVTRQPWVAGLFRILPPDLGFWVADRLSCRLADQTRDRAALDRAAAAQQAWAEQRLRDEPSVALLVMGHTHRACLVEVEPGRWYLNPGAWLDGYRYAIAAGAGVTLHRFGDRPPVR